MAVNLCTVGTLSSTSANTNVIVEENGALKRVNLNKVNEDVMTAIDDGLRIATYYQSTGLQSNIAKFGMILTYSHTCNYTISANGRVWCNELSTPPEIEGYTFSRIIIGQTDSPAIIGASNGWLHNLSTGSAVVKTCNWVLLYSKN